MNLFLNLIVILSIVVDYHRTIILLTVSVYRLILIGQTKLNFKPRNLFKSISKHFKDRFNVRKVPNYLSYFQIHLCLDSGWQKKQCVC